MAQETGSGPPRSDEVTSLAARLSSEDETSGKKGRSDSDRRQKRRVLIGRISRWASAGFLALVALVLFAMAGSIGAYNLDELKDDYTAVTDEEDRARQAQQFERDLPRKQEGSRLLDAATSSAKAVADIQNTYLDETGPVSLKGIPKKESQGSETVHEENDDGEYVCSEPEPGKRAKKYTKKERVECAEQRRADNLSGLGRKLEPYFMASARDEDGFNAATPWFESVDSLPDAEKSSLADRTWTSNSDAVFTEEGFVTITWSLRDDDDSELARITGVYDPVTKKFGSMSLSEAATEGD